MNMSMTNRQTVERSNGWLVRWLEWFYQGDPKQMIAYSFRMISMAPRCFRIITNWHWCSEKWCLIVWYNGIMEFHRTVQANRFASTYENKPHEFLPWMCPAESKKNVNDLEIYHSKNGWKGRTFYVCAFDQDHRVMARWRYLFSCYKYLQKSKMLWKIEHLTWFARTR